MSEMDRNLSKSAAGGALPQSAAPASAPAKPARPRPQVMRLTQAAAERIRTLMARNGKPVVALRVGVKNGGCAGMSYTIDYADEVLPSDEVVDDQGVKVLVDPKAVLFLLGTEMDFVEDGLSAQFVFRNPNQTGACGCGESVQLTPAVREL